MCACRKRHDFGHASLRAKRSNLRRKRCGDCFGVLRTPRNDGYVQLATNITEIGASLMMPAAVSPK
jgi:hypothetical protein